MVDLLPLMLGTICTLSWNFAMHSTGFSRSIWRECKTSFSLSSNHNLSWFFQLQLDLPLCFYCYCNAYNNTASLENFFSFLKLGGLEVIKFMESVDAISCHVFRTFCLSSFFWNAS